MAFLLRCWFFFTITMMMIHEKTEAYLKIIVDHHHQPRNHNGSNFPTIQSAINSIPSNNDQWVLIHVKAGVYREKVMIPYDKPYIILEGEGKEWTQIVWDDRDDISKSATFSSMAHNTVAKDISFVNSYNRGGGREMKRAVAAMIGGDKSSFYRCGFYGLQDTLWDALGRHYFKACTIQGAVDFIFGSAQSMYQGCEIEVVGRRSGLKEGGGYGAGSITAQGREDPQDPSGFVFRECVVSGQGSSFLGRPWRPYSRVLFYNSNLSNVVEPRGWDPWNSSTSQLNQITFAEYGCYGAGAATERRVRWEKKLSFATLHQLTSITFIDNEGWIQKQPSY